MKNRTYAYPYGEPHRTPAGQPILYGGKEHDPVTGEYNYDARRLFAPMLLMTTVDPLAGGTPQFSPYVFCAANPVRYIDMTGCKFTASSMYYVNMYLQEIQRREDEANAIIEMQNNLISSGTLSEKQIKKANKQIDKANQTLAEMKEVRLEIDKLKVSNQMYEIGIDASRNNSNYFCDYTTLGTNGNVVCMINKFVLGKNKYNIGSLAHELKHAYQFEIGELSFSANQNGTPLYDLNDEYVAYERGMKFGQRKDIIINQVYQHLQKGPYDVTNTAPINHLDEEGLQKYAEKNEVTFRVGGRTYNGN